MNSLFEYSDRLNAPCECFLFDTRIHSRMPLAALAAAATAFADRREIPEIPSAENPYWGGGSIDETQ